jgi:hypothetical protein
VGETRRDATIINLIVTRIDVARQHGFADCIVLHVPATFRATTNYSSIHITISYTNVIQTFVI